MKENKDSNNLKENKNLKIINLFTFVKNYARNCRYSFNSMLSL